MLTCFFEKGNRVNLRHTVVHTIVEKDGQILLVKRADFLSEAGKWALPGGFLERNETAKEGALRELLEETGWSGEILFLLRINSNPNRPHEDRQNVALEFIIKPLKQIEKPDHESSEIKWWPLDEIDKIDFAFDHKETVKLYLNYLKNPFPLPVLV